MTRRRWRTLQRQILAEFRQAERTRELWANPFSVYSPDPDRLAVVEFNAGLRERSAEMKAALKAARAEFNLIARRLTEESQ